MEIKKIGGIDATAPLFNGAPAPVLEEIVGYLSTASYNFADDSGREWGRAQRELACAARLSNEWKLGFTALKALHDDAPQLLSFPTFIDAVLKDLR